MFLLPPVPKQTTSVNRKYYNEIKEKADKCDKIIAFAKQKRCTFTSSTSKRMISLAMSFAPIMSLIAATRMFYLIYYAIFKEIGIGVTPSDIVNVAPSHAHVRNMTKDTAAEILAIARRKCENRPLFLSIDAENKQGTHHMVKELATWNTDEDSLFTFTLDADACDRTNIRAAEAVDHSLHKIDNVNTKAQLNGNTTNAGSGGVHEGLLSELTKRNRMAPDAFAHSYSLCTLNLMFSNPICKYFGTGGVKNYNSIQLLFTCYALEREFELETWKRLWLTINKETYGVRQTQPVLTR